MLSARGSSQLASKVGQLLKMNAANKAKLTEGGKGEDEINWLLAKDKVHFFMTGVWVSPRTNAQVNRADFSMMCWHILCRRVCRCL